MDNNAFNGFWLLASSVGPKVLVSASSFKSGSQVTGAIHLVY